MIFGLKQKSLEENLVDKLASGTKPVKSLMWYVGYIIVAGIVGVIVALWMLSISAK